MIGKTIITDTCFWIGLLDPTDQHHSASITIAELIEGHRIIFPWPCLYETLSTRITRQRDKLLLLEKLINKPEIVLLEDTPYKENALKEVLLFGRLKGYSFSLTDSVVREILKDINIKVNYLVSFNNRDFSDICALRNIMIYN